MTHDPNTSTPDSQPDGGATRRRFLQGSGAVAGAVALGGLTGAGTAEAATTAATDARPGRGLPRGFNGDISDLKHVVILMQEVATAEHGCR